MSEDDKIEVVEQDFVLDGDQRICKRTGEVINIRDTRPLLYISGPMYSEGWLAVNVNLACLVAEETYKRGWAPVIPHCDVLAQFITRNVNRQRYMDVDLALIRVCSAVLVLPYQNEVAPDGTQSGTSEELDFAEACGVPIYTLDILPYVN